MVWLGIGVWINHVYCTLIGPYHVASMRLLKTNLLLYFEHIFMNKNDNLLRRVVILIVLTVLFFHSSKIYLYGYEMVLVNAYTLH